jgi:hypothetical protein
VKVIPTDSRGLTPMEVMQYASCIQRIEVTCLQKTLRFVRVINERVDRKDPRWNEAPAFPFTDRFPKEMRGPFSRKYNNIV